MKTLYFFLTLCLALLVGCEKDEISDPIFPPESPTNVILKLDSTFDSISPRLVLQWTDSSDNEDGFILWRGNKKLGWEYIQTIPSNIERFVEPTDEINVNGRVSYLIQAYNKAGQSEIANSNEINF